MGFSNSFVMWNDAFPGKLQHMYLQFEITGAAASSVLPINNSAVMQFYGALTQDQIDEFLGTEDEFTAAQFDSTAMGADMFGVLINMKGQAASVQALRAACNSSTNGTTIVSSCVVGVSTLTDSSATTQIAVGADGNIALRVAFGNTPDFDALTAGLIHLDVYWTSK